MDIFKYHAEKASEASRPLSDRMRPQNLDEFSGQAHIVGKGALIRNAIENDKIFSMILWGPPGCGKTTLAGIVAAETKSCFLHFSAVLSGVKQIRAVIEEAKRQQQLHRKRTILFVDEIHRFNKAQQDAFLQHVESGLITLIGATTENPSFEVIPALLSRCRLIVLEPIPSDNIKSLLTAALKDKKKGLGKANLRITDEALDHIAIIADGDVRRALNSLEISASLSEGMPENLQKKLYQDKTIQITLQTVENAVQKIALSYDKTGEEHYNIISAFHKSLRGSDPDGAVYWLGRMLQAGEDPLYPARRMVRFASEDVGNADPNALGVALSAMEAFRFLGRPEGDLALFQAAVYLAAAPKSNSIYATHGMVKDIIDKTGALPVPLHIRNAPTKLMRNIGYGKNYKYAHDYQGAFIAQEYLPEKLRDTIFYAPTERGYEKAIKARLENLRKIKNRP